MREHLLRTGHTSFGETCYGRATVFIRTESLETMLSRRTLLVALAGAPLAACQTAYQPRVATGDDLTDWYIGSLPDQPHPIPLVDRSKMRPELARQTVRYAGGERPGTIVVDIDQRFLYLVQGDGTALRYGVGVGRSGFGWSGSATIKDKQEWPDWYPPKEMIARQRDLRNQLSELRSGLGVPGGTRNPLGARAMYLWQNGKDTLYRIHGTLEPWTIGSNVSSGCIRMINQDVIDLYARTPVGTKVVVLG